MDKVVDLSSRKIESISRIGLPSPKRNQLFFGGGVLEGLRFWILTFLCRAPKKHPKEVSGEKSICKSSLIS